MLLIDGRRYEEGLVSSVAVRPIPSRQPVEYLRTDSTPGTYVEKAGERAYQHYILDVTFNNDALLHEEIYQHLKGLELTQKRFWLSLPQMSREFATLVCLDKEGYVWATPTWPVYPHRFITSGNVDDFSYSLYVNRSVAVDGFTIDQSTGIVTFTEPQGSASEILMRYNWMVLARIASANLSDSLDIIWKTGSIALHCDNTIVDALPEFTEYTTCVFDGSLYGRIQIGVELEGTAEVETTLSGVLQIGIYMEGVATVTYPTVEARGIIEVGIELQGRSASGPIVIEAQGIIEVGIELEGTVSDSGLQPVEVRLWADGSVKYTFPLTPNANSEPKLDNILIPESVWQSIVDLDTLQVEVIQNYGYDLLLDKIAIHTSNHTEGPQGIVELGFELLGSAEVEETGNVFVEGILEIGIELVATVTLERVGTGEDEEEVDPGEEGTGAGE